MINANTTAKAIGMMSLMKFFPGEPEFRAALAELLGEMCSDDEQVLWVARQVRNRYQEWPGAHEVRAVLCSKYKPRDGIEVFSAVYVDGFPSERESSAPQLPSPERLALPEGHVATVDPDLDRQFKAALEATAMPPLPEHRVRTADERRVDEELRVLMHLPPVQGKGCRSW